ncbi:MFS transporter [Helicobacter sp. 13S00477-4]|uniref:MFS transporter n=1 Tax=Helicobacter sp. 13S00477-4 TaxID=1905759 RepID=UPI000BA78500|nr:MFS transporter [Helicobacter sp. 13S00477-4]PAF52791.1 hypothetical protein BKH44_01000 [Helicobacter sp. 13S00477-4]
MKILKENSNTAFLILPLIVLCMGQFGTSADNNFLAIGASAIISNLNANISDISLANSVYSLIAASFMIAGGLIAIVLKLKNTLRIGLVMISIGEFCLAFSPNITFFIWVGRVLTGLGASLLIPSVLGLVAAIYENKQRAIAFGFIGTATGIAKIFGMVVGGYIIDFFGFRFAFAILGFYFIIVLIMSIFIPQTSTENKKIRFDFIGTIIASLGLFLFVIGINKISVWGLITPIKPPFEFFGISPALLSILIGIILLTILIPIEKKIEEKHGSALLPKSFYSNPAVRNGLYGCAMVFGGLGAIIIVIDPFFMLVAGFSAGQTGIAVLPASIMMILFSMGVPKLFPDINRQLAIRIAYVSFIIGFILCGFGMEANGVNMLMYIGLSFCGAAMGILTSQADSVVANSVNKRDAQQSGGIQATTRNIGESIIIALLGMFLTFMLPLHYSNTIQKQPISEETKNFLHDKKFRFMSNQQFNSLISNQNPSDQSILKNAYISDRLHISKIAMFFAAFIAFLSLFGTSHIPKFHTKQE